MAFNSKRGQLFNNNIELLLGSRIITDNKNSDDNSDLDPCYVEDDGDTSYDSDEEGGTNLSAILGGAANAAHNDD